MPGSRFKVDCNTCICLKNGRAACTKKGCHNVDKVRRNAVDTQINAEQAIEENEQVSTNNQVCTPNEVKMEVRERWINQECVFDVEWFLDIRIATDANAQITASDGSALAKHVHWQESAEHCQVIQTLVVLLERISSGIATLACAWKMAKTLFVLWRDVSVPSIRNTCLNDQWTLQQLPLRSTNANQTNRITTTAIRVSAMSSEQPQPAL